MAQILNILERFDLKAMGANSADFVHVVTEAMKLAFADRAYWLGDPDFTRVPRGLTSTNYATQLASRIRRDQVISGVEHGTPPNATQDVFPKVYTSAPDAKHTTHFSVADAEGNWVACTATINTTFGSKVVIPGTGVVLNNEMDDFATSPLTPNAYGLVGGSANAVAAGRRPLSSMTPTILVKDGQLRAVVGTPGGSTISTTVTQIVRALLDYGVTLDVAVKAPRVHHQWKPDRIVAEPTLDPATAAGLKARGHEMAEWGSIGHANCIEVDPATQGYRAVADVTRDGGEAVAY